MKKLFFLIAEITAAAGITMVMIYLHNLSMAMEIGVSSGEVESFDRHYLFISSDESQMLQDIYGEMAEVCALEGAYLEWCGKGAPDTYSAAECVDISIAMNADGILVYPDGGSTLTEAIKRASEAEIPVVTILKDLTDSERVSYVGVSDYQRGEMYGGQLLSLLHKGENDVCLLMESRESDSDTQLIYTQMVQAVKNGASSGKTMNLRIESVDSRTDFDAEEVIREILLSNQCPDILICLNSVQTECAIQALIDYNLVGKVNVIGYYVTDTILQALRQDLIPVTMTIDTESLAEDAVQALNDYLELGRASSYYNISLSSITPKTVDKLPEQEDDGQELEEEEA